MVRAAAVVTCVVLAAACVLSGADRAGKLQTDSFGTSRLTTDLASAMAEQDSAGAIEDAKRLVSRAPIERQSAAKLGLAYVSAHDLDDAFRAFSVAATTGWRDASTRYFWIGETLASGDFTLALRHADARLRVSDDDPVALGALRKIEGDSAMRADLAQTVATAPWVARYLGDLGKLAPDAAQQRLQILAKAKADGLELTDDTLAPTVRRLLFADQPVQALQLWTTFRGIGGVARAGVWDPGFTAATDAERASPFLWTLGDDAEIRPAPEARGGSALFAARRSPHGALASTTTVLPAGTYVASWKGGDAAGASSTLDLSVSCPTGRPLPSEAPRLSGDRWSKAITIPAGTCARQRITIVSIGSETREPWVTDISLHR